MKLSNEAINKQRLEFAKNIKTDAEQSLRDMDEYLNQGKIDKSFHDNQTKK